MTVRWIGRSLRGRIEAKTQIAVRTDSRRVSISKSLDLLSISCVKCRMSNIESEETG